MNLMGSAIVNGVMATGWVLWILSGYASPNLPWLALGVHLGLVVSAVIVTLASD